MKSFYANLLEETLNESAMTDSLNDLQDYWSANAEYFMNQSSPLFPMLSRPFDRIRKGGVLIIGINPGSGKTNDIERKKVYDVFKGKQPPVFNKRTRTWRNVDFDRTDKENRGGKEKNVGFSTFNIDEWKKRGGGNPKFQKNMSSIMKKIGRTDLSNKIMMSNIVPFPSNNEKSFGSKKSELMRLGFVWVQEMIKTSKPKVIITAGDKPWKALQSGLMTKTIPDSTIKAIKRETGQELNVDVVKVGFIGKTPVIGFHHPSIGAGQPGSVNFEGKQLEKIQAVFDKYVPS